MKEKMPVIFIGHGSPMLALENSSETAALRALGREIEEKCGKPKGILGISAHWFTSGTGLQSSDNPEQIYDMYGFPRELYEIVYPARGDRELAQKAARLLGPEAVLTESHGIDHGLWTVLLHMFPGADVPVVAMSVDGTVSAARMYALGQELAPLRSDGILILASGAVVHNLRALDPSDPEGSVQTRAFMKKVAELAAVRDDAALMDYEKLPYAQYAVPTPDHYLPLIYALGAGRGEKARIFNHVPQLGSTALTSFVFGLDGMASHA